MGADRVSWQDISAIVVYRLHFSHGLKEYKLIVHVKDPDGLPHRLLRAFSARLSPKLGSAGAYVTLNYFFVRATPAKIDRLLERIVQTCAQELAFYGVWLRRDIAEM